MQPNNPPHSNYPPSLAELEMVQQTVSFQINQTQKDHGDSIELQTMRSGLLQIEEKIAQLRLDLQILGEESKKKPKS